jgi:hypothetical protein
MKGYPIAISIPLPPFPQPDSKRKQGTQPNQIRTRTGVPLRKTQKIVASRARKPIDTAEGAVAEQQEHLLKVICEEEEES